MRNMSIQPLSTIVFREFFKAALLPLLFIELTLVLLYFGINAYNHKKTISTLETESIAHLEEIVGAEAKIFSRDLRSIAEIMKIVQGESAHFFADLNDLTVPDSAYNAYRFADNGVYYKPNDTTGGSSLFFSTVTQIGAKEKKKAVASEQLDHAYKLAAQANSNIVAVYLNTFDSMNRYYPFIADVYAQFLPDMDIPKFNFYYLADAEHNPGRETIWTETYLDPAGQGWMMSCIAPVYREDFLEGVVGIDITIDVFLQNILDMELPWGAKAFLVDAKGTIMAMPEAVEQLFDLTELRTHVYDQQIAQDTFKPEKFNLLKTTIPGVAESISRILTENKSVEELHLPSGQYLLAHATEQESGWKLMVVADKNVMLEPVFSMEKQGKNIGYAAVSGMVLFYILFIFYLLFNARRIAAQIASPVAAIAERSTQIAKGNYDAEPFDSSIQELVTLNMNYTSMVQEIQQLNGDLREEIHRANREIEERKQAEKALKKSETDLRIARDNAEAANRAKSAFLSNMSHELRTPLHHIIGFSELLGDEDSGELNERQQEYLSYIQTSSQALLTLINDVLDLAGVGGKEQDLQLSVFNLQPVLENSLMLVKEQATQKQINLSLKTESLPETIEADERKLKKILYNLLSNGVKFTSAGGSVEILATQIPCSEDPLSQRDEQCLKLSVKDNGIGIKSEDLQRIFSTFEQVEDTKNRLYDGVGMGLTLTKSYVELHHGYITAESEGKDKGTTIHVVLPLSQDI
ncbi:cache domain-containing sensor histidine kinase [Desulfogranum japonicum]|uniref:cache domain-containing sensor histidine kinase n=1 Tax=Desulfogranum japonicum TaxID=231447 RepID=UPI0003F4C4BF|nr:ATP-binding protein [Desulfogranum japonicum]